MIADETAARHYLAALTDDRGLRLLERFAAMLREENARQNLVSAATLDIVWQRHFADSAQLLNHVPRGTGTMLDLGTGAGFPGVVIALLRPDLAVTCVESRPRRADWLQRLVNEMSLSNCRILATRLELVESFHVDAITARAFATFDRLLALAGRFSTRDTIWLLPKGRNAARELARLPVSDRAMFHVEQSLTDPSAGIVVGHYASKERP